MREINNNEISFVAGGLTMGEGMSLATAAGAALGFGTATAAGATATTALGAATVGGVVLGGLTASGIIGWAIGNFLNENTPIQRVISYTIGFGSSGSHSDFGGVNGLARNDHSDSDSSYA